MSPAIAEPGPDDGVPERVDPGDWLCEDLPAAGDEPLTGAVAVRAGPADAEPDAAPVAGVAATVRDHDGGPGDGAAFDIADLGDFDVPHFEISAIEGN
jgi:hypothetical protein